MAVATESGALRAARAKAGASRISSELSLATELVISIGGLRADRLLGPWPDARPSQRRRRFRFTPGIYGENDTHPHAELCLLLNGRCGFSFDHIACRLEAGDLVVLPGMMPHAETYYRSEEGYRLAWWVLTKDDPGLHITRYSGREGFVMDYLMRLSTLPAEASARLAWLRDLASQDRAPNIEILREALLTITLALFRRILGGGGESLDNRAPLVRRAIDFVRANAGTALDLAEVARAVRVSPNYLTSLFRTETGTPLGRFVLEERIALAKRKLREPMATVKCVALDLGFADQFAFSRAFKRITGMSPRIWMCGDGGEPNMPS